MEQEKNSLQQKKKNTSGMVCSARWRLRARWWWLLRKERRNGSAENNNSFELHTFNGFATIFKWYVFYIPLWCSLRRPHSFPVRLCCCCCCVVPRLLYCLPIAIVFFISRIRCDTFGFYFLLTFVLLLNTEDTAQFYDGLSIQWLLCMCMVCLVLVLQYADG